MKEARSWLDWLTFSCSCAKSYITDEPAQHVEALTWLSCQKVQENIFSHYFTAWAKAMGESQHGRRWRMQAQQAEETSAFGIPSSSPAEAVCVGGSQHSAQHRCDLSMISSAWIPACTQLQHAAMSIKAAACVFHFCIWQSCQAASAFSGLIEYQAKATHAPEAGAERIYVREVTIRAAGTIFVVDVCTINRILPLYCPSADKRLYCWRYQYHDVTTLTDMLIRFGSFMPVISWTATLPQASLLLSHRGTSDYAVHLDSQ